MELHVNICILLHVMNQLIIHFFGNVFQVSLTRWHHQTAHELKVVFIDVRYKEMIK